VLQGGVGGQDGVVRLDDGRRHLGSGVHGELELGLLPVVDRQTFHEEGSKAGAGTSSERVEDEEALETGALVGQLPDAVEHHVDDFLADCVMASGVVVSSVFLARDQLLGVEQLTVSPGTDFVDHGGLEVDEDSPGDVLARPGLAEESVERVVTTADGFVRRHLAVRLDAMFQAVKLPAGVTDLDTRLTNVDRDTLTL